jgi:hypothetical protein
VAENPQPGDALGVGTGQAIQFADLSGDGMLDVIVSAELAANEDGRVYVWVGGIAHYGAVTPTAELSGYASGERLGHMSGQGVFAIDVTGDGILDIVAGSSISGYGNHPEMGEIYVYDGVSGFENGLQAPSLSWSPWAGTLTHHRLGDITGPGVQFFDVTGDYRIDVISGSSNTGYEGAAKTGAAYVWEGGPNMGSMNSHSLTVPGAVAGDQLTRGAGQGIRVHDLTGDGILDLLVSAEFAGLNGVPDAGAFYVWEGGPSLATTAPRNTLRAESPLPGDRLGGVSGSNILIADPDYDSIDDIVIGSQHADHNGVTNTGAYYFFSSGVSYPGEVIAYNVLSPAYASTGDQLGRGSFGMDIFDMTGDGLPDLLIGTAFADESCIDSGALYLWEGGGPEWWNPEPATKAVLMESSASPGNKLGY